VEQVVYAALAVKPDNRFESMAVFADVLEQMARGEKPILGKELIERSQPKKKRSITPLVAAIILSITLLVAVSGYWFGVVKNQGSDPTMIIAEVSETTTITSTSFPHTPTASSTATKPPPAPTIAVATVTATPEPVEVDRSLSRKNIDQIEMLQVKEKLFGEIESFALSPDGLTAVIAPLGNPGAIWDLQKDEMKQNLLGNNGLPLKVKEVAFSPDGTLVAGLVDYGDVWIWKAEDLSLAQRILGKSQSMQFSPDSQKLAIHNYEELYAQIWDLANKTQTGQYIQRSKIENLAFSTDSKFLWVNTSLSLNIWRVLDGTQVNQLDNLELANGIYTIISPRNDLFYTNGRLWNVEDFSLAHTISEAQDPYPCASFSSSGELLAVCDGNQVILWDTSDGRLIKTIETSFTSDILDLIFSSNGNELIIAAKDGSVEYWGVRP
jgi:WD40 repeat protein